MLGRADIPIQIACEWFATNTSHSSMIWHLRSTGRQHILTIHDHCSMVHRPAATEKMSPSNSPGNPPAATSGSKSRAGAKAEPEAVPTLRRLLPTSRPPARAGSEIEVPRRRRTYTTAACEACRKRKAKVCLVVYPCHPPRTPSRLTRCLCDSAMPNVRLVPIA